MVDFLESDDTRAVLVRPDEAQKILSLLRQRGSHTVIDKIAVNLSIKKDCYEAEFSNLGLKVIPIDMTMPFRCAERHKRG